MKRSGRKSIDGHSLDVLEFSTVREILAHFAASALGQSEALALRPSTDRQWIQVRQQETTELKSLLEKGLRIPLQGLQDIRGLADQVRRGQVTLEPVELLAVAGTLNAARELRRFFDDVPQKIPHLRQMGERLGDFEVLIEDITRCVDAEEGVRDQASDKLREIRRQMESLRNEIGRRLRSLVTAPQNRAAIENENLVSRNERLVVAVKANYRGHIPGLVLDRSNSGLTLYVEPYEVAELANQLEDALYEERQEVNRILGQLTREVLQQWPEIEKTVQALAWVDLTFAKARFSLEYDMQPCYLREDQAIVLRDARHPLLLKFFLDRDPQAKTIRDVMAMVVPMTIYLGEHYRQIVVTGPNTGGKTVVLKTMGLAVLMNQSGMHVPCAPRSELPIFRQVYADIGDEQSLQQSLSTFSAHLRQIAHLVERAGKYSLVLLDELGSGTDPSEGAALGAAVLDFLGKAQAVVFATTHLGKLKEYATVTDGVENASVEFDTETLQPTYRLMIGVPGSSNALTIAQRLGLPQGLIKQARQRLSAESGGESALLNQVQAVRADATRSRAEADALRLEAEQIKKLTQEELGKATTARARAHEQADLEIDRTMRVIRRTAEAMETDLRNAPKPWSFKAEQWCQRLMELARSTPLAQRHAQFVAGLRDGDYVWAIPFKRDALIIRIHRKRETMTLMIDNKQVELEFNEVRQSMAH